MNGSASVPAASAISRSKDPSTLRKCSIVKMPGPTVIEMLARTFSPSAHTRSQIRSSMFAVAMSSVSRSSGCPGLSKAKNPLMTRYSAWPPIG